MSYYARVTYTAGGRDYTVPFDYLDESHIHAYDGIANEVTYVWTDATTIRLSTTPSADEVIIIRNSDIEDTLVTFTNGATLSETDLNTAVVQLHNLAQENHDNIAYLNASTISHGNAFHTSEFITDSDVTFENLSANSDIGTGATQVAQGDHNHNTDITFENLDNNSDVGTGATQVAQGDHTHTHADTTGQTTDDHHAQAHALTGSDHTESGLTTGHFLKATGAAAFGFEAHGLDKTSVGLSNVTDEAQIAKSIGTTKGDMILFTGDATPVRIGIGTDGLVLTADSSETNGMKWSEVTVDDGSINHGDIIGLGDDDHTQYALLAGRATDQNLNIDIITVGEPDTPPTGSSSADTIDMWAADGSLMVLNEDGAYRDLMFEGFPGAIDGLIPYMDPTDPSHDLTFAVGSAMSDDGTTLIRLESTLTKLLDATWAVGDGNGGMESGDALPTSATIHVFLIKDVANDVVDIMASTSLTPTLPGTYTKKRRIFSTQTDASANIMAFYAHATHGGGIDVLYTNGSEDASYTPPTQATWLTPSIDVPDGIDVKAHVRFMLLASDTTSTYITVYIGVLSPDEDDPSGVSTSSAPLCTRGIQVGSGVSGTATIRDIIVHDVWTSTATIRWLFVSDSSGAPVLTNQVKIITIGFEDPRRALWLS